MTDSNITSGLGTEEIEILAELMNIGFGAAAADLSSIIDIIINISVPQVQVLEGEGYQSFLSEFQSSNPYLTISMQNFLGKVSGKGILIIPGENPFFVLSRVDSEIEETQGAGMDVLNDLTSVMVGASISKISEILEDSVTFEEPEIQTWKADHFPESIMNSPQSHIVLEANFSLEESDYCAYLMLMTDESSLPFLKDALARFSEEYL